MSWANRYSNTATCCGVVEIARCKSYSRSYRWVLVQALWKARWMVVECSRRTTWRSSSGKAPAAGPCTAPINNAQHDLPSAGVHKKNIKEASALIRQSFCPGSHHPRLLLVPLLTFSVRACYIRHQTYRTTVYEQLHSAYVEP